MANKLDLDSIFVEMETDKPNVTQSCFNHHALIPIFKDIEQRIAKLENDESTFHPVEIDKVAKDIAQKCNYTKSDGKLGGIVLTTDKQSPKICPVTGMFLEEPVKGTAYFRLYAGTVINSGYYADDDVRDFHLGNCFATEEDAERYAAHLKAMAKLRRSGEYVPILLSIEGKPTQRNYGYTQKAYDQLTPQEQNALKWPNEEK